MAAEPPKPRVPLEEQLDEALRIIANAEEKIANRRAADMEVPSSWVTKLTKAREGLDAIYGAQAAQQKALGNTFQEIREATKALDRRVRLLAVHNANYGGLLQVAASLAIRNGIPVTVQNDPAKEKNFLILDLPQGQVSFAILHKEAESMASLAAHDACSSWDGHDTNLKRDRIHAFMDQVAQSGKSLPS